MANFLIILSVFISASAFAFAFANEERFPFSQSYQGHPAWFINALEDHILNNFEADHPLIRDDLIPDIQKCNLDKKINHPVTFRKGFNLCYKMFYSTFYGGYGKFQIDIRDQFARGISLDANAPFVGGHTLFPISLSSNILVGARYWYLPSFSFGSASFDSLGQASFFEINSFYNKRLTYTPLSARVGVSLEKLPITDTASLLGITEGDAIDFRSLVSLSLSAGLRMSFDRNSNYRHLLYADIGTYPYVDGGFSFSPADNYLFRAGDIYFIKQFVALNLELERKVLLTKYQDSVTTNLIGFKLLFSIL